MTDKEIVSQAIKMREKAYAPYSHFSVGAAILGRDGKIYGGANVENASYGAAVCAERTAALSALMAGCRNFEAIAVVSSADKLCTPCGICRQFLSEFSPDMRVICAKNEDEFEVYSLDELLPHSFKG